jgi:hypothetical protein
VRGADLPHVPLYEGTKQSFATDAIRRGVPERLLQRFLRHASITSMRHYARLADTALVDVLPPRTTPWRQAGDKCNRMSVWIAETCSPLGALLTLTSEIRSCGTSARKGSGTPLQFT